MIRNVIGSILALIGATAAVWSPFRDWYDGRHGNDYRVQDLFEGITSNDGALLTSVLLPMAFAALLTLIGLLLRSRLLVALSGLVVLGSTVLWMIRQGQATGSLTAGGDGLGPGVALAFGGGVLLLLAAALMSGRRAMRRRREEPYDEESPGHVPPEADDWGPYGRDPYGQDPNNPGPYQGQGQYDAQPGDERAPARHSRRRRH